MKIAVLCNDTRGGIQPYLALAQGLKKVGHDVRAVAPSDFAPLFVESGIPATPLSGTSEAELQGSTNISERGIIATMRFMARELPARINTWTKETLEACEGADVITGGVGGMVIGLSVAEKLAVPFIETHLQPVGVVSDVYPGVLLARTPQWLGKPGRRFSHFLSDKALWMSFQKAMTSAREKTLGLKGRNAANRQMVLYGFSRHVVPVTSNGNGDRERHATGYWSLPASTTWKPPPGLEEFLTRGGPVVSIGFGSMASDKPEAVTKLLLEAVRGAGVRAVLLSGWNGIKSLPNVDNIFFADSIPHDWLFARVAAVVHHGGAGTTGAALQVGVPAVVVPFTMDQPFWGLRVAALGVGPQPIPRKRLTSRKTGGGAQKSHERPGDERACRIAWRTVARRKWYC